MTPAIAAHQPRVLVVDDNEDAADSLATLLGVMGYEVRTAYDGPEAITAANLAEPALWERIEMAREALYALLDLETLL